MAQILISKLTVEDINSALLRLKRTIDNNEAAFDTKVNSAVSNLNIKNTYSAVQKYDDSQLRADINKVSDLIKDINSTLNQTNKYVSSNTEKISQLQTLLTNIDVTYDSETNTLSFTDYTGEEHDYELKDTTYTFSWDESTRTFTVTDDITSDSQSFTFSDTKYTLSYSNGVLTFTPSSGTATNIDLKDTFYTESEIRTLVLDLIPNTASASNQLADKNWVNSSIETATATFRGTFTNINDLYATSGDNNDYAFLKTLDPQSSLYTYDRYKWTPNADPHWQYEYTINTSGFTADQLAALNSGITCTLVSKITDVYNCKITLCQNGTCVGSFTLNQNSDSSFNLDGGSISACAKTDNVWRNLLSTDCAASGSIDSTCFSTNIKANSSTGIIQSMNTSNWSCIYSSCSSCVGCYILLAQLNGSACTQNHDNTIGGVIYRNAAGVDVPYRFVISVRGRCTTVGNTYFRIDKCTNIFYATYQVGTNGAFTLRLYTKVTTNYTRYNTRIDYLTNGDVSIRVSNWTCITFPNTYFASLPSTETLITRENFYTKCDVGLNNVDNTADANKSVKNADCFNGCTYACACADFRSGLLSDICFDVYCGTTCKCTVNNAGSLCLKPNAFNDYAAISTTTYPGACCTGTLVASDLEPYQTTDCADSKYVFKCILAYPGGDSTCTRYVKIKTLCSRALYGNTFRIGLYSMDATLNLDNDISYYYGSCYGNLKFSKCASSCTNSDCFWLSYFGWRYPTICSSLPFEVLCTVTTAPSGIIFSSFSCQYGLVKYSSVATSADRKLLMAAHDGTENSVCPVYFSSGVPLTYNACTGALNIGSDSQTGYLKTFGEVCAKWYCTTCCQVSFSFPAQSTTYVLLGCLGNGFSQNENQLGFFVSGTSAVNLGVLKILPTNANTLGQNNIELKLANYTNTSYGITGIGFVKTGTTWNCSTCVILKVCNPGTSANTWYVGIHRNQIKCWTTCLTCLGSTTPTFTGLIDVPTDCRTFYYNNAVACFSNKIQGPAYDANGCAYITSSSVKDSTITLCLNGESKGTFTLNQAANCEIDLGCTICRSLEICRNAINDNNDRPLAILGGCTSISNASIYVSCGCPLTFNASNGTLINGNTSATNPYLLSKGCCIKLNKSGGQSELLFTVNNDITNYCSLGIGIGSGCINRGIYDCCGGTFRWLQYWDASDNEIHNRPTCAPYFRANYCEYIGFTFIKPDNGGNRAYYLLHDITNWYNGTTDVANRAFIGTITRNRGGGFQVSSITSVDASYAYGRNGAALTCYTNTQHSIYSYNIYTNITFRTAVLKDTANNKYYSALEIYGSQSCFRFDGFIFGAICGTWVCTTNSSGALPSGWELLYTGCLKGGKTVDVYCGSTCKCTLYNGDSLCLGTLAFSSATIPTVNDSTITLCLNGASKGTFTLNQASASKINLGCVICCAACVQTFNTDTNYEYKVAFIDNENDYQCIRSSCGTKPFTYVPHTGLLTVNSICNKCCFDANIACISSLSVKPYTITLNNLTKDCGYWISIGCPAVCSDLQGNSFSIAASGSNANDTVCMYLGNADASCSWCTDDIRIDASNRNATYGIQGIGIRKTGSSWNCRREIYLKFIPPENGSYCFTLYRNNINSGWHTCMTNCGAVQMTLDQFICTKPNGSRAFHYMNGDFLAEVNMYAECAGHAACADIADTAHSLVMLCCALNIPANAATKYIDLGFECTDSRARKYILWSSDSYMNNAEIYWDGKDLCWHVSVPPYSSNRRYFINGVAIGTCNGANKVLLSVSYECSSCIPVFDSCICAVYCDSIGYGLPPTGFGIINTNYYTISNTKKITLQRDYTSLNTWIDGVTMGDTMVSTKLLCASCELVIPTVRPVSPKSGSLWLSV